MEPTAALLLELAPRDGGAPPPVTFAMLVMLAGASFAIFTLRLTGGKEDPAFSMSARVQETVVMEHVQPSPFMAAAVMPGVRGSVMVTGALVGAVPLLVTRSWKIPVPP